MKLGDQVQIIREGKTITAGVYDIQSNLVILQAFNDDNDLEYFYIDKDHPKADGDGVVLHNENGPAILFDDSLVGFYWRVDGQPIAPDDTAWYWHGEFLGKNKNGKKSIRRKRRKRIKKAGFSN